MYHLKQTPDLLTKLTKYNFPFQELLHHVTLIISQLSKAGVVRMIDKNT